MRFVFLVILFSMNSIGIAQVGSKSYNALLKNILSHSVNAISVDQAFENYERTVFLDARENKEYLVSHIPNARFIGYDNFNINSIADIPKDQCLVVYCSIGYRSEKISEKLEEAGYTNVSNLFGGIFEWKNQDFEVVDPTGSATENVHAYSRIWGVWLKKGNKVFN